jgi:arylsulfatase A-like enzyme
MVRLTRRVAVLLVLLSVSLGPGALRGVGQPASPVTSSVESHDLAAMALNPDDLDAEGLNGFGQQSSALLASGEQAERFVPGLGRDPAAVRAALAASNLVRRYESELGRAAHSSRLRTFVVSYLLEYASVEGASAGFALLSTDHTGSTTPDVLGGRSFGDRSQVRRFWGLADFGEQYQALNLTFHLGNLVAGVTVGEFGDRVPELATLEALGGRLLTKLRAGQSGGGPGLSNLALRLAGPGVETRSDEYGRLDGRTLPNYDETAEVFADRAARYGDATDVYGLLQSVPAGGFARADDVRYLALLYRFDGEQAAADWLQTGAERAATAPNVAAATTVDGAPTVGDESLTVALSTAREGEETGRGYLTYLRVGAEVAQVQLVGLSDVPLTAVAELARAQAACLGARACPTMVPPPAGLPPPATPAPAAALHPCAPVSAAATGTPAPETPIPVRTAEASPSSAPPVGTTPPNIVLIVTDDLDARSAACLPNVQSILADEGVTFANFFVTTPLCCPSRASILRGQYAHNHGVLGNTGDAGGYPAFFRLGDEESTAATWLQDAGYRTALFGKYLNRYPKGATTTRVPPGWDEWAAFVSSAEDDEGASYYTDYTLNEDGTLVAYGDAPSDYSTDVLSAKATDFVTRTAASGQPFFLYLAPYAPHGPAQPALRDAAAFADAGAPRVPSFDEAEVGDKPAWVRDLPQLSAEQLALIDARYQRRLRSLLAVDAMVAALVETLRDTGALENTYVVFTSDNGYHLGEHRLALGKSTPYDESIRVPLIVRGPGVSAGAVVDELALNIDLAPTFAALAGATPPDFVDGRSLTPLLRGEQPGEWREGFLIERRDKSGADGWATPEPALPETPPEALVFPNGERGVTTADAPPYLALRTSRYLYVEYADGGRELYDLLIDPYELENLAPTADPALLDQLSFALSELRDCAAAGCRSAEDSLPLPDTSDAPTNEE